jgi:hypothetical protein
VAQGWSKGLLMMIHPTSGGSHRHDRDPLLRNCAAGEENALRQLIRNPKKDHCLKVPLTSIMV